MIFSINISHILLLFLCNILVLFFKLLPFYTETLFISIYLHIDQFICLPVLLEYQAYLMSFFFHKVHSLVYQTLVARALFTCVFDHFILHSSFWMILMYRDSEESRLKGFFLSTGSVFSSARCPGQIIT